ncbi:hypothetical protein MRB53_038067 [Persea americana]|nr:hypothetical protein MRB53_038067 [Persea americana]
MQKATVPRTWNISNAHSQASLDSRISNDVRQQAFQHLEAVKSQPNAPLYGFELAGNSSLDVTLRYYGLQLLEFAIRYRWNDYGQEETAQLLAWVTSLTDAMRPENPLFLRNKLAQLWVEVAKRSWGEEWTDMDQQLAVLWDKPSEEKGVANKILVLRILEQLSEDVINGEDAVAGLRLDVLGNALNEIILPYALYTQLAGPRKSRQTLDLGTDGWLRRICSFFAQALQHASGGAASEVVKGLETAALRALDVLRSAMSWISLTAADEVSLVEYMYMAFHSPNLAIQTAAVEVLFVMLSRHWNPPSQETWIKLCRQALRPDRNRHDQANFRDNCCSPR